MSDDSPWEMNLIALASAGGAAQAPAIRALWVRGWLVDDIAGVVGVERGLVRDALNWRT